MFIVCKYTQAKKYKKYFIFLLFFFMSFSLKTAYSQSKKEQKLVKQAEEDAKELEKINPAYISILPKDKILIGMHSGGIDDRFVLRDNKNENYYHLTSSIVPSVGLHFKYKRLPTFSFSLPINIFSKKSPFITKGYSMALHFQPSRLLIMDMYFFQISGLKLHKVGKTQLNPVNEFHGSNTFNITSEMFFLFNNAKYSYKNAFLSGEIQKKSAGSVVLGISFSYFNQKNSQAFFTPHFTLNKTLNYEKIWGFSLASMIGYLHTFVISEYWYFGGGLLYGPNLHFGKADYYSSQKDKIYVNMSSSIKAKFTAGYNSKHVLVKIIGHTGFYAYKPSKKNAFNNYVSDFRMSITYII